MDSRDDAVDYGAIVPGEPEESLLIERITSSDADLVMPPRDSHKVLSEAEKQTLIEWIRQGAEYQKHWSFEPLAVDSAGRESIDAFVDAKLREQKLEPSPPASRERWLRRVTLDLTGLPPRVPEIDAFLADDSPEAYERVVDRLLASPAYGERMAAEWLDVARYSDTFGYQVDRDRFVWPWRDWVIRAFNNNLPYEEFITHQLAGDLLPKARTPEETEQQILATTFNRLNPQESEGGSVEEEYRVEYVVDRAQTVSTALMGLTFECARCHDHKFDPLTQKEFYKLNAFFANINEAGLYSYHTKSTPTPTLRLPTDKQREQVAAAEQAVSKAETRYADAIAAVTEQSATDANIAEKGDGPFPLSPVAAEDFDSPQAEKLPVKLIEGVDGKGIKLSGDKGLRVGQGKVNFRRWEPFSVALWLRTPDTKARAVVYHNSLGWTDAASRGYQLLIEEGRLSAALVHFWPGNAINVRTADPIPTKQWLHVAVTYDGSSRASGLRIFINGQPTESEVVQDGLTKTIGTKKDHPITIGERTRDRGFTNGLVDEFEVYDRELTVAEVRARTDGQPFDLNAETIDPRVRRAQQELQLARQERDKLLDGIKEIMVMRELPELRKTHVLNRGVYNERKERVTPGTPAALPPMPDNAPPNRLGLAKWLTSPNHPLTARVAVNRYWQLLFGRGLVVTTEDFGSQGSPPSHPDLLDWLAQRFIDTGWDTKQLLKMIALSDAYRRDSRAVGGTEVKDPENIWLARGPAAPLTAEMIRDAALATSGLLSDKIGGEPAKPYELAVSFKPVKPDKGDGLYRRSLYTYWKRTAPAPVMLVLDASTRDVCRVRRERTSSPLQAMVLLNGPQYVEAAQGAAARVLEELGAGAPAEDRLVRLFRRLTSRTPDARELSVLERLYADQRETFAADKEAVSKYLSTGEFKEPEGIDRVEIAAMAIVAQAVMNLDDYLMKR